MRAHSAVWVLAGRHLVEGARRRQCVCTRHQRRVQHVGGTVKHPSKNRTPAHPHTRMHMCSHTDGDECMRPGPVVRDAQITDEGVSLVENLELDREPMEAMEAIYFVSPTYESMKAHILKSLYNIGFLLHTF